MSRHDLRYVFRQLAKNPGFTLVAVLTLALGIGANAAIFSVVHAVLLRPLPFPGQDALFVAWKQDATAKNPFVELSIPEFNDWRARARTVESLAAMPTTVYGYGYVLTGRGEAAAIESARVSADYFKTLGVEPLIGRTFTPEEDRPGAAPVVLLSEKLWRERFDGDPGIVGTTVALGQKPFSVIGVVADRASFPKGADVWTPLSASMSPRLVENRGGVFLQAVGRLKPGTTLAEAEAEFNTIIGQLAAEHPEMEAGGQRIVLTPLTTYLFGDARPALWLLLAATGLLLLLACANVANLLLARAISRRREFAVRAALGAGRWRLVRETLVESLVLTALGGTVGLGAAGWILKLLAVLAPPDIPRLDEVRISLPVLAFTGGLALLTSFVAGIVPAFVASKVDVTEALADGGGGIVGSGRSRRLRSALVAAEIAVSVMLLIGAGLLARSFANLRRVELGFDPRNLLTCQLSLQGDAYREAPARRRFFMELFSRLESQPGIVAASGILIRPLEGAIGWDVPYLLEGQSASDMPRNVVPNYEAVAPHYFRAMDIPLRAGRDFTAADSDQSPRVAIVSETMARALFPTGVDPIGKRIKVGSADADWTTIVGVAGDARYRELKDIRWDVYVPFLQVSQGVRYLTVRTASDPNASVETVRKTLAALDPNQAITGVKTMEELVGRSLAQSRFTSMLMGGLAGLALFLAAIGIYGVTAYSTAERTREIGIRMALGARTSSVLGLILRQGMTPTVVGAAVGMVGAFLLTRTVETLLFGVAATDPATFFTAAGGLLVVALLACWFPARRAARVDPTRALRMD